MQEESGRLRWLSARCSRYCCGTKYRVRVLNSPSEYIFIYPLCPWAVGRAGGPYIEVAQDRFDCILGARRNAFHLFVYVPFSTFFERVKFERARGCAIYKKHNTSNKCGLRIHMDTTNEESKGLTTVPSNVELLGSYKASVLKKMDITEVCAGLYLSDFESLTKEKISDRSVKTVINAALEMPKIEIPGVTVIQLPVYDIPNQNIMQYFNETGGVIKETKEQGGSTLVHCALGISRSVTICLAYLVKHEKMTLRSAYYMLKEKRPVIKPNDGFWRQLITFETSELGKPTVKMIHYPMGSIPDVYKTLTRPKARGF